MVEVSFRRLALRLFGGWVRKRGYREVAEKLRRARFATSVDMYMSTGILSAWIVAGVAAGLWMFFSRVQGFSILPSIGVAVMVGADAWLICYVFTLIYPSMLASHRIYEIDRALPHAVSFMHALSRSGAGITDIFKELSLRTDIGKIAEEAKVFMRDVGYLGYDPLTALRGLARSTASRRFGTFLEVLASVIETGGDKTAYFESKCAEFQNEQRAEQRKLIESLGFLAEVYIIGIVFAPLLLILSLALMGALGGLPKVLLYLAAYVGIPVGSMIFLILLAIVCKGWKRPSTKPPSPPSVEVFSGVPLAPGAEVEEKHVKRLLRGTIFTRLKLGLLHPLKLIWSNPAYTFLLSGPAAAGFLLLARALTTSTLFIAALIALVPYVAVFEARSFRISKIEGALLDFLRSLGSGIKSGLTLSKSLAVVSSTDLGPLTKEVQRAGREVRWGRSAAEALVNLEQRVSDSAEASRTFTLIRKASEAHTDISNVLEILTNDVGASQALAKERRGALRVYQIIIFLIFFVFLFTSWVVVKNIMLLAAPGGFGGIPMFGGIEAGLFKTIIFHATLFEGFFGGMVVAQMSEGDVRSGLKYSLVLMVVAFFVFTKLV